jgi:hypothetical protein
LFQSDSDYQNSIQNTIQQLYGGVSNSFASNSNNFMVQSAAPVVAAPVTAVKAVTENQKPVTQTLPAKEDSGFHPFKSVVHSVQEIFHHDQSPPAEKDTPRGLDLEAEIGKRKYFFMRRI